jgi:hypothetical protein
MCLKELSGYDPAMFAAQTAARLAEQGVDPVGLNGNSDQTPPADDDDDDNDKQDGWIEVGPIVD